MNRSEFDNRLKELFTDHQSLIQRENEKVEKGNGIYTRYKYPTLTREHTPVFWRYDLNFETNPFLMERLGVNTAFNAGAMRSSGSD